MTEVIFYYSPIPLKIQDTNYTLCVKRIYHTIAYVLVFFVNAFLYLWFNLKVLVCFWILPNVTQSCVAENWALSIVRRCWYQLLTAATSINLVISLIMFFFPPSNRKITNKMLRSIKNWFVCSHREFMRKRMQFALVVKTSRLLCHCIDIGSFSNRLFENNAIHLKTYVLRKFLSEF